MNTGKLLLLSLAFFFLSGYARAQMDTWEEPQNSLDFLALGNRGFLSCLYSRTIVTIPHFTVATVTGLGVVPGSHDQDTIPALIHVGAGANLIWGEHVQRLVIGLSYAGLLKMGRDKLNSETKKYTNGLLGELGYMLVLPKGGPSIKLSFTPILVGEGYRKMLNFPVGLTISYLF